VKQRAAINEQVIQIVKLQKSKNRGCAGIKKMCETAEIKNRGWTGTK